MQPLGHAHAAIAGLAGLRPGSIKQSALCGRYCVLPSCKEKFVKEFTQLKSKVRLAQGAGPVGVA